MAKKIRMWQELGPRISPETPAEKEEVMKDLIDVTNLTKGSVSSVLFELDALAIRALQVGRIVKLPNGTTLRPIGKKDGSIRISVRLNPTITKEVNSDFRGTWINAEHINISEEELIQIWNEKYPDDLIEE